MPSPLSDESEAKTRRQRIDPLLRSSGWEIISFRSNLSAPNLTRHAVTEFETANGPADYALFVAGQPLSVVEAKKVTLGPQNVLTQAERYSRGVADSPFTFGEFRTPFLYSTNGEVLWFHDVRHPLNRSRRVAGFHTPASLDEMLTRDFQAAGAWFGDTPNNHPHLRPYQIEANRAVEQAIADRKRQMLVAMATGTGKTFTMVNQVYRLMKSGVARRILFLVDRRALAAQAVNAFAAFEPEPGLKFDKIYEVYSQRFRREDLDENEKFDAKVMPAGYLLDPQTSHAFVYVCTIQRMAINLFGHQAAFEPGDEANDDEAEKLDNIPIHAFDLIVADECHRGYTSSELSLWRNTLEHFDAIKVGLTATPAAHTKAYFNEIVYRYEYERAVREGFLVDFDAVTIKSDVRMNGLFLKEGDEVRTIDPESGLEQLDRLEDERQFESGEIERKITAPESNRRIIQELKKYTDAHEQKYGRFPKTLIFACNDIPHTSHADRLVEMCREVYGRGDSFVQKITGTTTDRPLKRIREFRNRPYPGIVVTVDMLSTGVDIPALQFIVFLRPVKSRILWEQMLGRGTRLCKDLSPPKSHFTIFDCFDGSLLEYFRNASAFTVEPPEKPSRTIAEVVDDIWQNRDRGYNVRCLVKRLQRTDKEMSGEARELFAAFIPDGDLSRFAKELPGKLAAGFTATMELLRRPEFQDLLVNYPRPKRVFLVAPGVEDSVSSTWLVKGADGREYRPQDYLQAFSRFVKENPAQIEAIRILLDRPRDWSTDSLAELRQKLAMTRERFTMENLEKAHAAHYHKNLVDIISMVKHAAKEEEPLFTAVERVERAFGRIMSGRTFTAGQQVWLSHIREHLIANLSVEKDDFDTVPVLFDAGGWSRARQVFDGTLSTLIEELNEAIAA